MSKDKKKEKEDELYLANLEGMVRFRAILRKYGVSAHIADLATEALDKMVSEAVSAVADRIEESNASTRKTFRWGVAIIGTLVAIVAIIVAFKG